MCKAKADYIGTSSKELTDKEIDNLGNLELNICDKCSTIEITTELYWLEYELLSHQEWKRISQDGKYIALCHGCWVGWNITN